MADGNEDGGVKRDLETAAEELADNTNKKIKTETDPLVGVATAAPVGGDGESHSFVPPGTVGVTTINDNDVLSGRGGGTNLHPGNRQFRDLINLYRRDYLKARKNDKPAISRSIVNAIREKNGRFLKKVEKTGLWFEIGDDAAREKTSQALRQRAPEMRKLLLDHEMEGARQQQQMMGGMMGMPPGVPPMMIPGMNMPLMMPNGNMAFNPAMMGMPNAPMFNPAMMGMPPMNFNQAGMPQPAPGQPQQQQQQQPGMPPNNTADGSNNNVNGDNPNETNNGSGEGGGEANVNGEATPAPAGDDGNTNNANAAGFAPNQMNPMMNPMAHMAAMAQMNPTAMGMNMMAPMPPNMPPNMQQQQPPVVGGVPPPEAPPGVPENPGQPETITM